MVMENTMEHTRIFGLHRQCVVYFDSVGAVVSACRRLPDDAPLRALLRAVAVRRMWSGNHSYEDRLSKTFNR